MATSQKTLLPVINDKTCKADEIGFLNTVAVQAQEGSYLHEFFTPSLMEWVKERINNDFPVNIWEAYLAEARLNQQNDSIIDKKDAEIRQLKAEISRLNGALEAKHDNITTLQDKIEKMQERHAEAMNNAKDHGDKMQTRIRELNNLVFALVSDNPAEVEKARDFVDKVQALGWG